jgi:hypothetical protein
MEGYYSLGGTTKELFFCLQNWGIANKTFFAAAYVLPFFKQSTTQMEICWLRGLRKGLLLPGRA